MMGNKNRYKEEILKIIFGLNECLEKNLETEE